MIAHAKREKWFSNSSIAILDEVNRTRRNIYHLQAMETDDSLLLRAYEQRPWRGKENAVTDMRKTLHSDALQALRALFIARFE